MMLLFAIILIFAATFFLVIALAGAFFKPKVNVKKRMERYITSVLADVAAGNIIKSNQNEFIENETAKPFWGIVEKYGKRIEAKGYTKQIEIELQKGDIPLRGYEFIFLIFILTIGFVLLIFLWNHNVISMAVAGLLGITGPLIYLRIKQQQKGSKFNNQISDALVMVSNSLKAGYGFMQAIDLVAKEMAPPIQTEFARVIQEINLGVTTEEALTRLTERVPSPDLDLVVTAMLIQRQIGGNLSEILDNISQTIRERVRIQGEVKALTAQGRLSGLIIGLMPLGIGSFLLLVNPKYIAQLFTDPRGQFLLGYAIVAELIALLIIRKIITIKV
jgi:tight adherence protein B